MGYLPKPTRFEVSLLGTGWQTLALNSKSLYRDDECLWKSYGTGQGQWAEAAAVLCVGHQLKAQ